MTVETHLRIARSVSDLQRTMRMYKAGLSLEELAGFEDHEGFDGAMRGARDAHFHFEFTFCRTHAVSPSSTPEDLLVFYVPERDDWRSRCDRLLQAGFSEVRSFNPYWDRLGRTLEDPDGYRVVIQQSAWSNVA